MNSNWTEFSLQDIVDPKVRYSLTGGPFGSDLKSSEYTNKGIRIIQLQNIGDGEFKDNYKIYTSKEKADSLSSCKIYSGEIIISKMGDPVARATLIPEYLKICLMASDGIRFKVDEKRFDKKFILEKINEPSFRSQAEVHSTGTTRQRIGLQSLKELTLNIPPLPEQKKIAEILSCLDELINLIDKRIKKEILLLSSMQIDLLGCNSEVEKKISKLSDFLIEIVGGGTPTRNESNYWDGDIPWASVKDITCKKINITKETITKSGLHSSASRIIPAGIPILVTRMAVGRSALFNMPVAINQDLKALFPDERYLDKRFLFYFLVSKERELSELGTGSTVKGIRLEDIKNLLITLPSLENQQKIANFLNQKDNLIELLKNKKNKIINLKKSLSEDLLNGKKRVKVK